MVKSMSSMSEIEEICEKLRKKYFGKTATRLDFRDSFVVNEAIIRFNDSPNKLLDDEITEQDESGVKISKSLNLRAESIEKLTKIASLLGNISEAETMRRILYYSVMDTEFNPSDNRQITSLKAKAEIIKTQLAASMKELDELMKEIQMLEENIG